MNILVKRILIAAVLMTVCAVIFAATKLYGVWVITGIAVALVILGLLRKDEASGKEGDTRVTPTGKPEMP